MSRGNGCAEGEQGPTRPRPRVSKLLRDLPDRDSLDVTPSALPSRAVLVKLIRRVEHPSPSMVRPPTLSSGPWAGGRPLVRCRPVNSSSHVCKRSYPARQTPKTLGIGFDIYPGCGIFFVQGASLLRHAVDEYRKALINAVKMCNDRELVYEYSMWDPRWEGSSSYKVGIRKLAGRLFEGAWHRMLRDEAMHDVPQPPWCPMPYKPFTGNLPLSVSHLSGYFDMSRNHTQALMKEWGHPVREAAQHRVGADANHEQGTSGRAVRLRHHF